MSARMPDNASARSSHASMVNPKWMKNSALPRTFGMFGSEKVTDDFVFLDMGYDRR